MVPPLLLKIGRIFFCAPIFFEILCNLAKYGTISCTIIVLVIKNWKIPALAPFTERLFKRICGSIEKNKKQKNKKRGLDDVINPL